MLCPSGRSKNRTCPGFSPRFLSPKTGPVPVSLPQQKPDLSRFLSPVSLATGEAYQKLRKRFESIIDKILKEKPPVGFR